MNNTCRIISNWIVVVACIWQGELLAAEFDQHQLKLAATKYQMKIQIDYDQEQLQADVQIDVKNVSQFAADHIPLRLYRLLQVQSIRNDKNQPLPFSQRVVSDDDWPQMQTNYIEVALPSPLLPGESCRIHLRYHGYLLGYEETGMSYVKDQISRDFSLLRMDALAYPLVTYPNNEVNQQARFWLNRFDYDVSVTVPSDRVVANGGELLSKIDKGHQTTYRYVNKLPAWRMDFAIAAYQHLREGRFSVFSWETDAVSRQVLEKIQQTFALYEGWFGPLKNDLGYVFIEVPEGYGAQADVTSVIQDAAGFTEMMRMYHEVSHQWNVKTLDAFPSRWNEGLATFLQWLTAQKLEQQQGLESSINQQIQRILALAKSHPEYQRVGMRDFGQQNLNSYLVGGVFFALLYDVCGASQFNQLIGGFYQRYYETGATTEQFIHYALTQSSVNVEPLFRDWFESADYLKRLKDNPNYAALLEYYRENGQ